LPYLIEVDGVFSQKALELDAFGRELLLKIEELAFVALIDILID
jgi:hypothetical protein